MNILPQKYNQFKDKQYWDHFFSSLKNTQNEFFQWYGAYSDYKHLLKILINPSSSIFHVGCGKSIFSEQLLANNPTLNIINCDYSQNVIAQMKQRTIKNKIKMEYQVCDLLVPLSQKYAGKFDIVLDKGTLDAMLPQDSVDNIKKIKQNYFVNMQRALIKQENKQKNFKFIIISLLQPFVLRTIIQYYAFKSQKYQVDIYECLIKDSKLQPFLVCITYLPKQQDKFVRFHTLADDNIIRWATIQQVLAGINKRQEQVMHGGRIKQLSPGRRTKFNIYNKNNRKKLRYLIQIVDAQNKQLLNKNTCSIFIVPQGKQTTYLFNDDQGIKQLHDKINSSRLILIKLVTGNEFDNLQKVKKQLNSVVPDFIQNGCDVSKAPYLTDADELGQKCYLFQNQEFIVDEVMVDGQPLRRLFTRGNPTVPQCQFKLTYLSQNNNKHLKDIKSNILPIKKNMVTGIDRQQLFDDYARYIYSGINTFIGHPKIGWKILLIGCQFALVKFLLDMYQNVQIVVICGNCKSIKQVAYKYLQIQQSQRLNFYPDTQLAYLNSQNEQKFNIIINCLNQDSERQNPSLYYTSTKCQQQIIKLFDPPGLYIVQYKNYQQMPNFSEYFFPVYGSRLNSKEQNILFCLRYNKKINNNKIVVHSNLVNIKPKGKLQYKWEADNVQDIVMVQPSIVNNSNKLQYNNTIIQIQKQGIFEDIYGQDSDKNDKKNKKKKKKK